MSMKLRLVSLAAVIVLALSLSTDANAAGKVRLFILSGQSNMAGLNPEISFIPTIKAAYPDDECIFVKDARGGQPIRRWYKKWHPAEGTTDEQLGQLYEQLMSKVTPAIQGKKIDTVAFAWMQGERDAKESHSAVYAESMKGLIGQLRTDLGRDDMVFVIGRLSDNRKNDAHWDGVREAQVAVAQADPLGDWVDTDDLNGPGDGLHYTREGYAELGKRFAEKTIALLAQ